MKRWGLGQVMGRAGIGMLAGVALGMISPEANAAKFRRPFNVSIGVNYGFDNYSGSGCRDYACGSVCYNGHSGTDFPLSVGTTVVAAANGRIGATYNGCANYGGLGNTCGGRCGNYVRIDYTDGSTTIYCHLELNSISVSVGQQVTCGQAIGRSASSGNSSGPHLHFGLRVGGVSRDPFAGSCSQSTSYWVGQGSYPHPVPSAECESVCACTPGQAQTESCGNCGSRQRTCGSNCNWGSWSACTGQGECATGSVESQSCCDCGTQTRRCSGQCSWEDWSDCEGPDPNGGDEVCDTGEPGICAEGRIRCVEGCLACTRLLEPRDELCNDVDDDCDGTVDNGFPQEIGDPLPAFAARLVDHSHPQTVEAGDVAWAWATFRNEGHATWPASEVWLVPASVWEGTSSPFADGEWPAFDVAAVLKEEVPPGGIASLAWSLNTRGQSPGRVEDRFQLASSEGSLLRCPTPHVDIDLLVMASKAAEEKSLPVNTVLSEGDAEARSGCACRFHHASTHPVGWVALLMGAGLFGLRTLRRKRIQ